MRLDELNDQLDDLIRSPVRTTAPARKLPEGVPEEGHFERCHKCGGSGIYRGFGRCFACKGKGGATFKTSFADRAKNRQQAAERKVRKADDRMAEFTQAYPAEAAWMVAKSPRFEFASSMLEAVTKFGGLTENQLAAVRKCMVADEVRATEREANKREVDVSKIEAAFAHARERANRPGQMGIWTRPLPLTSTEATGKMTLTFQPGSAGSKWEGMVFVKAQDGRKLGHVKDGKFAPKFGCTEAEVAAVIDCAGDPASAAKAYGKAWSRCCVCNRTLTNDGSIEAGIGPICAQNYGF